MPVLASFQTSDKTLSLMQSSWATVLNPLLRNPSLDSHILPSVTLSATRPNNISHGLQRKLIGWRIIRLRTSAVVYDTQDANPNPTLTLNLVTSADTICDIEVF